MSWPGPPGPPGPVGPTYDLFNKPIQSKHYIRDMTTEPQNWPRIRDLPEGERIPFSEFLVGQTIPWLEGVAREDQDGYYEHDYRNWKRNPKNRFFD